MEVLAPVLREPYLPGRQAIHMELLPKLRSLFMATYFGFDHLVWLGSVNIIKDRKFIERYVPISDSTPHRLGPKNGWFEFNRNFMGGHEFSAVQMSEDLSLVLAARLDFYYNSGGM